MKQRFRKTGTRDYLPFTFWGRRQKHIHRAFYYENGRGGYLYHPRSSRFPGDFLQPQKNASHFIFFVTPVLKYTINNVNSRQSVPGCKPTLRFIFCCLRADDRLAFLYSHLNSLLPYSILECLECLCYNYHQQEPIPPDSKKVLTPDGVVNKQTQTSHY